MSTGSPKTDFAVNLQELSHDEELMSKEFDYYLTLPIRLDEQIQYAVWWGRDAFVTDNRDEGRGNVLAEERLVCSNLLGVVHL
jgi:hypothetical protein